MGRNETQMENLNHQDLKLVLDISAGYTLGASVWVTGGSDGSKDLKTTETLPLGKHILPTDNVDSVYQFSGARAVTSSSGQGAIVQHKKHIYKLTCEVSGCTWRICLTNSIQELKVLS